MKTMLEHVALRVNDLERSIVFYRDGLGFKPVGRRKVAEGAITQVVFRIGEGVLVLFHNANSERVDKDLEFETRQISAHLKGRGEQKWRGGIDHFSIAFPDEEYQAVVRRLKEHGYTPHRGPEKNLGAFGLGYATYFYDPNNIEVEIKYYDDPPEQPAPELLEAVAARNED